MGLESVTATTAGLEGSEAAGASLLVFAPFFQLLLRSCHLMWPLPEV